MFVTIVVRRGSFISLFILLVQMLVECNGFDFFIHFQNFQLCNLGESIESSICFVFGYDILYDIGSNLILKVSSCYW